MSGEKRSVATDALEVLGLPDLGGREVGRDAIHLAVEPAVAGVHLEPGSDIRRIDGLWYNCVRGDRMAIVDPFLESDVERGGRFLAIVPPRQITSLRHVWEHPEFPSSLAEDGSAGLPTATSTEPESSPAMFADLPKDSVFVGRVVSKRDATQRLTDFATRIGVGYDELLSMIGDGHGYTTTGDNADAYQGMFDDYEAVTGRKIENPDLEMYFSCSC